MFRKLVRGTIRVLGGLERKRKIDGRLAALEFSLLGLSATTPPCPSPSRCGPSAMFSAVFFAVAIWRSDFLVFPRPRIQEPRTRSRPPVRLATGRCKIITLVLRRVYSPGAPAFAAPGRLGQQPRALRGISFPGDPLRGADAVSPGVPTPRLAGCARTAAHKIFRLGPRPALSLRPSYRGASLFRSRLSGPWRGPPRGSSFYRLGLPDCRVSFPLALSGAAFPLSPARVRLGSS